LTALARASGTYKRQTRPLVREGAPRKQERNCQTEINIWSWAPDGARYQDLLTDRQSQCDFDFDLRDDSDFNFDFDLRDDSDKRKTRPLVREGAPP
jgi:hypothetical protein